MVDRAGCDRRRVGSGGRHPRTARTRTGLGRHFLLASREEGAARARQLRAPGDRVRSILSTGARTLPQAHHHRHEPGASRRVRRSSMAGGVASRSRRDPVIRIARAPGLAELQGGERQSRSRDRDLRAARQAAPCHRDGGRADRRDVGAGALEQPHRSFPAPDLRKPRGAAASADHGRGDRLELPHAD